MWKMIKIFLIPVICLLTMFQMAATVVAIFLKVPCYLLAVLFLGAAIIYKILQLIMWKDVWFLCITGITFGAIPYLCMPLINITVVIKQRLIEFLQE